MFLLCDACLVIGAALGIAAVYVTPCFLSSADDSEGKLNSFK